MARWAPSTCSPTTISCAPTSPTGCSSTRHAAASPCCPPRREEVARGGPRLPRARACRSWRAARAPACRAARCRSPTAAHRASAGCAAILEVDLANRRVVVEPGVTNLADLARRSAPHALLPARPVEPDRVHDRRQRRRELRRRALLQVRLHDNYVLRPGGGAARRRGRPARRQAARPRPATTCSARSSAPRARSASSRRSPLRVVPAPEAVRTLVAFFDVARARRRGGVGDHRGRRRARARSR